MRAAGRPVPWWVALAAFLCVSWVFGQLLDRISWPRPVCVEGSASTTSGDAEAPGEVRLDQGNAICLSGLWRDCEVSLRLLPARESALEIRLRAPRSERDHAAGISFITGCEPRFRTSFHVATETTFERVGFNTDSLGFEPGPGDRPLSRREYRIKVSARGHLLRAFVDDRLVAEVEDDHYCCGGVVILAVQGHLIVGDVALRDDCAQRPGEPHRCSFRLGSLRPYGSEWVALAGAFLLVYGLALCLFAGRGFWLALLLTVLLATPALSAIALGPPQSTLADVARTLLLVLGGALLLVPLLVWRHSVSPWAFLALPALVAVAVGYTLSVWPGRQVPPPPGLHDWSGPRLERELLYVTHPAFRAGNPYLARHRFRSGEVPFARSPGEPRVFVLGATETWGEAAGWPGLAEGPGAATAFPARLEQRAQETADLGPVEVMNAAWPGATLAALTSFTTEVVLEFEPTVILLTLSPEVLRDMRARDVAAYLDRITGKHHRHTLVDRLLDERAGACGPPVAEQLDRDLRGLAVLLAERDVDLVLVLWPGPERLDGPVRNAVQLVAREFGLRVVDLELALARSGTRATLPDVCAQEIAPVLAELLRKRHRAGR